MSRNHSETKEVDEKNQYDDEVMDLISARRRKDRIYYRPKDVKLRSNWIRMTGPHAWNLEYNEYRIERRKEFIIFIDKDGVPSIHQTTNNWTRSDFGPNSDGSEYILVQEVYPSEQ